MRGLLEHAFLSADDSTEVGVELLAQPGRDERLAVLGAEYVLPPLRGWTVEDLPCTIFLGLPPPGYVLPPLRG